MNEKIKEYYDEIDAKINIAYNLAEKARSFGYDPLNHVEIPLARNMAERVEGLISSITPQIKKSGIVERIEELEKTYGKLDWRVAMAISLEVAQEKFCKFKDKLEAMEIGIRVGLAYLSNGVVSSPLEGFTNLKIKKRRDGKEYFSLMFSGPIRSAGTTITCGSIFVADYIRVNMGYSTYDPEEKEIKRIVVEIYDYHERVTNIQYLPSEQEIEFMISHMPMQIDGDPSERFDVSNYKDLDRIETNKLRNGVCLVTGESLCQKAPKFWGKISKWYKEFNMEHWKFLEDFVALQKKVKAKQKVEVKTEEKIKPDFTYIKDLVAGRPVLTHPLRIGGFRLRYGHSRTSGYSSMSMHPATMQLLKNYIGTGTQLRYERPGKSSAMAPCDTIEGPIVKLKNQNVIFVEDEEYAKKIKNDVEEILFLGDFLINYGEFFNRAHVLVPCGYNEEWWLAEFERKIIDKYEKFDLNKITNDLGIDFDFLENLLKKPNTKINFDVAKEISLLYEVPLHPRWVYHWNDINKEQFLSLLKWIEEGKVIENKIILPYSYKISSDLTDKDPKRVLELIGVPHEVILNENIVIKEDDARALLFTLNDLDLNLDYENVLEILNKNCKVVIRDKSGTYIGARMGRPEKAKMRKLNGNPHVLFPVGEEGGKMRSLQSCLEKGKIIAQFPLYFCEKCNVDTIYPRCEVCNNSTQKKYYCSGCDKMIDQLNCERHGKTSSYLTKSLPINNYLENSLKKLKIKDYPELIKGVRGTSNEDHTPENLCKGILRAVNDIYVNKDGTIRYDMTEMPIVAFKPKEIGTSMEKLKELGYYEDIFHKPLINEEQLIEIFPSDVILPACKESPDEGADLVLLRIANFVDDLLENFYNLPRYYNAEKREDLVGHIILGLAPHTSAAIAGRIIGFSKTQGCFAHPMWHAAQRRDCVYPKTKFVYYDLDKKEIFYEEIGDFVENLLKNGARTKIIDKVGTLNVENKKNILVIGINPENRKLVFKKVKCFIKGPLNEKWVKITTATNRELIMTQTHKFMHLNENKNFIFKDAINAKVDDKIPIIDKFELDFDFKESLNLIELFINNLENKDKKNIKILNCEEFFNSLIKNNKEKIISLLKYDNKKINNLEKNINLLEFEELLKENLINYDMLPKNSYLKYRSEHKLPVFFNISKGLLNILGTYSAEGYSRENKFVSQISFRILRKELQDNLIDNIKDVFDVKASLGENNSKITICSKLIYLLFVKCFKTGSNAYNKRVPNFIFTMPKDYIADYISSYLDGDGSIINERNFIVFYSVNRSLLDDVALLCSRFGIIARYHRTKERMPGKKVIEIYNKLNKEPKKHVLNHLIFSGLDATKLKSILRLNNSIKSEKLNLIKDSEKRYINYNGKQMLIQSASDYFVDYVKKVDIIDDKKHSYCVEIEWKNQEDKNILWGEQILNTRCEGDENAIMLLLDCLINFSKKYLPAHRGATQDAPLVITSLLTPSEVDDMVFDLDVCSRYPLEFYQAAQEYKWPWEVKVEQLRDHLGKDREYYGFGFTHDVSDFNTGIRCSAYKYLPSMQEKVLGQIELAELIRAVDEEDVARLVIERHFIRDIRGNLRKFSTQEFRCVNCNEKYRRPPLIGICSKCHGRIVFTVAEGFIVKYLQPALDLAEKFNLPSYLRQSLELTKLRIESMFGKDPERQEGLKKWF